MKIEHSDDSNLPHLMWLYDIGLWDTYFIYFPQAQKNSQDQDEITRESWARYYN